MCIPRPVSLIGLPEIDRAIETFRFSEDPDREVPGIPTSEGSNYFSEDDLDLAGEADIEESAFLAGPISRAPRKPKPVTINISLTAARASIPSTALLHLLVGLSVLPQSAKGKQNAVVYIDCSHSFSATQLNRDLVSYLKENSENELDHPDSVVESGLQHVHILRCTSSKSLLTTLQQLSEYLLNPTTHQSSQKRLGMLIIDHINQFYWQDRLDAETAKLEANNSDTSSSTIRSESLATQIMTEVQSIQDTFNCAVVYTTNPAISNTASSEMSYLTSASDMYIRSALLNLEITQKAVLQFSSLMSLEDCLRDRQNRAEAVSNADYWVSISPGGMSERRSGPDTVQDDLGFRLRVPSIGGICIG